MKYQVNEKLFQKADTFFVVNDHDEDLQEEKIYLPEPPSYKKIAGYNLPIKEQKWRAPEHPKKLLELEHKFQAIDEIWAYLYQNQHDYKEEINWIRQQWNYRLNGYWFFNNGKPTFIDGWHYFYLAYWQMDIGLPDYRDRDRRWFLFARHCATTTKDFYGNDYGRRTCFGFLYPKHRRDGATHKSLSILFDIASRTQNSECGIQSFDDDNAREHFRKKLMYAFLKMPFFFKPRWDGSSNPKKALAFMSPAIKGGTGSLLSKGIELSSFITYATTADRKFYEGKKLQMYLSEEGGKCFGSDVDILMADGSIKNVKDIITGDKLMGDDGTIRNVLSTTTGVGQMYKIIPNKGWKSWTCNDAHILSLKVSDKRHITQSAFGKVNRGDVVDIPIRDYLNLSHNCRRHLMQYKSLAAYKEKSLLIDPYFLGVWLGDGDSASPIITSMDNEIEKFLFTYMDSIGNKVKKINTKSRAYRYSSKAKQSGRGRYSKNVLVKYFKYYNLYHNKHIPIDYLYNTESNRLSLLAGIIDTDGSREGNNKKRNYEIIQKNEKLSYQIYRLALELGFGCSINSKSATMKRKDGTTYSCVVYRISIYGFDLYRIPCRIARKKYKKEILKKGPKNPLHNGFKIEDIGIGDYYGFVIDGNRRFLLADCTVAHNTVLEDVYARWQTMKETLAQGSGGKIHGFSIHPTTVYDMEAGGGQRYYDLCKDSQQHLQKDINPLSGQTKTGLRVLFIPAYDGLEGFIDEYGYSVIDKPTKEQAKFIKQNHGARHHLESQRKLYLDEGTPKAISSYNKLLSNYPISFAECFRVLGGENNGFNFSILDKRIAELRREEYASKIVMGNFEWEGGILDSKVAWVPDNSGKFIVTKLLKEGEHNQRILEGETFMPEHAGKFVASADVYQWSQEEYKKSNESSRGVSDGGGAVYWDRDFSIDPEDKDISTWESGVFACTYQNRPSTVDEYCEDMIKMCVYYGAMMFPEVNIRTVWEYFVKRGYEGYLLYDFDSKGVMRTHPGFASNTASKQELFNFVRDHIQWHGHRELQLPFLEDCKKIRGLKDMTNYDRWTACAGCLYAARKVPRDMYRDNSKPVDINDFFNLHSY